jgi:predicted RNA binding protein YcfA (HicA-like mRNA interferase family)
MTKQQKLVDRLTDRQFTGWTFQDLHRVLLLLGYFEVSSDGSHRTYKHLQSPKLFTVPEQPGELPKGYPREVLKRYKELESRHDDHTRQNVAG